MLSALLCFVLGCPETETQIPEGFMDSCATDSGCEDGLMCVENPHQSDSTQEDARHCSAACTTAGDCPEGGASCQTGNTATCVDGFCDYGLFCM